MSKINLLKYLNPSNSTGLEIKKDYYYLNNLKTENFLSSFIVKGK